MEFNWRKGLVRLWVLGSVIWIAFLSYDLRLDESIATYWNLRSDNFDLSHEEQEVSLQWKLFRTAAIGQAQSGNFLLLHAQFLETLSPAQAELLSSGDRKQLAKQVMHDAELNLQRGLTFGLGLSALVFAFGAGVLWVLRGLKTP